MTRPPVPTEPAAGFEWRIFVDRSWRLDGRAIGSPCRYTVGPGYTRCRRTSVARLKRGHFHGGQWWGYCERHLYGRWIEGGFVLEYRMRSIDEPLGADFVARA